MILENEGTHPHSLNRADFDALFSKDKPIHFNYHGYAAELKGLLFGRPKLDRVSIESYDEEGTTTTPFDMMLLNRTSRWHVAKAAIQGGAIGNEKIKAKLDTLMKHVDDEITKAREYVMEHGADPADTYDLPTFDGSGKGEHRDVGYAD